MTKLMLKVLAAAVLLLQLTDYVSSCGSEWMPCDDVLIAGGSETRLGFASAVQTFCNAADGQKVGPGDYLSMATEVFHNGGKDPSTYGVIGYAYYASCQRYFDALSVDGGRCSGEIHKDTKGGTWQIGDDRISYHALGERLPPEFVPLNQLIPTVVLRPQSVNKGCGAPLNPWPFDSHNDYDQSIPLFATLSAGCACIEADAYSPKAGRTLKAQHIEPLRSVLDHNNRGSPGSIGVYIASPGQSVDLLPLRDAGYLSYLNGSHFVQRQVTVSCTGSAPFDRIDTGDGVPKRDIFYDARLDDWDPKYTRLRAKVSQQVLIAHKAGIKVHYWDLPGDSLWEPLTALSVDRLNADDMLATARLLRV
ncbi:hypothetical protein BKA67DRAFT_637924 [Truncatella angustata]|uniref:Uncharacterized protein n=1 Tax=Truncatella angustata TaxID=152316 RepID=A0A9P8UHQ9_9PEZI|nr:uncharacterized protein BKA67DRAFT_637924 [Truncatella angustata]KAH6652373.1 hypothetical protein BKA67DRAFT_637924 [Truncatella angustata]